MNKNSRQKKYKIQYTEGDSFSVLCTAHLNENNKTIIILKDLKDGKLCVWEKKKFQLKWNKVDSLGKQSQFQNKDNWVLWSKEPIKE